MRNKNHSKRLLLISNSTQYGSGYLDHCEGEIRDFLRDTSRVLFFPFALYDRVAYANKARARFAAMGYELDSILEPTGSEKAVARSQALFVGGGNTFQDDQRYADCGSAVVRCPEPGAISDQPALP